VANINPLGNQSTQVWDAAGRRVAQVDPLGNTSTVVFNAANVPIASVNPLGYQLDADVRTEIKIIPATVVVVRHLRSKYTCRHCQNYDIKTPVVTAPMPTPAFPNSLASPSAVAYIMVQKFVEGSPLYRQETAFSRLGFSLSRQTMANWMLTGADY
jgi:YD repeat-containing protein